VKRSREKGAGGAPAISIVYSTHRLEPRFEWFADSLASQLRGDQDKVEVVVVDGLACEERRRAFEAAAHGRFAIRVVPAKPTPWNGPYRLTGHEYHGAASARNTGIVCSTAPYVVFQDDCSIVLPGWWREARQAARHRRMVVENGALVRSRAAVEGVDRRWRLGDDAAAVRVTGGHLAGGSVGVPRSLLLRLNGFDELCDPIGNEVAQLGRRLEVAATPILYSRRMLAIRSCERHEADVVRMLDKATDPDDYMRRLAEYGVRQRFYDALWTSSSMVLDLLFGTRETAALGNSYTLEGLDEDGLVGVAEGFSLDHWFDGQPLAEM
jgi:hypothetical protein